jgi:calcium-activated chloride channel regulator 4
LQLHAWLHCLLRSTCFSEDLIHLAELPNKHNLFCQGRSPWEVITNNPDFSAGANQPNASITNTDPSFRLVGGADAASGVAYVLVMDVSASMAEKGRFQPMKDAAKRWLRYEVRDNVRVGLVRFADENLVIGMKELTAMSADTREEFIAAVEEMRSVGRTCIGCGLKVAKVERSLYTGIRQASGWMKPFYDGF